MTPESIEVLVPQEVAVEDLEAQDPLVGQPSRRRISDLAEAAELGLFLESTRVGGSWDDLFEELELRARPMLDAGWRLVSTEQEESWEHGDSVFYDLERKGDVVELEYYEHGQFVAYPMLDEPADGDITEPFFQHPRLYPGISAGGVRRTRVGVIALPPAARAPAGRS